MADHVLKRIKLVSLTSHEPVEVQLPKNLKVLEAGFMEGILNLWVSCPTDAEDEPVKLQMLNEGQPYDPAIAEVLHCGIRPNGRAVGLLRIR